MIHKTLNQLQIDSKCAEPHSEPCLISKMERFAKMDNDF